MNLPIKKPTDYYNPKVVMSIHGIFSNGNWQNILSRAIISHGLISKEFKYGRIVRIDRFKKNALVDKFRDWYFEQTNDPINELYIDKPFHRPSIVAHSLGSWIIAKALLKYPEIKFDKIFLHGSIVPDSYDWYSLILNDQVNKIVVEKSKNDTTVRFGWFITGKFRSCARHGFIQKSTYIKYEDVTNFGHSDFQYSQRFINQLKKHLYEPPVQLMVIPGGETSPSNLIKYFKQSGKIDSDVYGIEYTSNNPVTLDRAKKWAQVEKNIWSFMINSYSEKVLGYINVIAVNDLLQKDFVLGKIGENDIEEKDVCAFDIEGKLNLIIMSIATDKHIESSLNSKSSELLISALSKKILDITLNGRKLNSITSIAWTSIGENLCISFGLKKTNNTYQGHPIYYINQKELKKTKDLNIRPICRWWINQIKKG